MYTIVISQSGSCSLALRRFKGAGKAVLESLDHGQSSMQRQDDLQKSF
jgi:hypothetical protein